MFVSYLVSSNRSITEGVTNKAQFGHLAPEPKGALLLHSSVLDSDGGCQWRDNYISLTSDKQGW